MELFRLLGTIAINNSDAMKAMDDTVEKGSDTQSKLSTVFTKIGSAAKTCAKVVGAGMLAASGAIIGLGVSALASYADFEQLVGGVETLFKESAGVVREYADEAYKSAGMSANAYMEQVTSFSASLIQSLNGDTQAAAEKANQAIIDMSDNANKMGTSIDMIQNAYQGFAKQNYTMLDNLKLGYGGTKEEMQRLLNDAQAISGVEYDISSYADVVDAIHIIQEEMGIAGTTAKEASSTISGSFNSMKAAWSNLLAGLGNENADLSALTDNFVNSALTVADNVVPRIEVILGGMVTVIEKLLPKLMEHLPSMLQSFLPSLVRGATALVTGLIKALPSILMLLTEQLPFILSEIGKALVETAPVLLEAAQQLFGQVWEYIMSTFNSNGELDGVLSGISAAFSAWMEYCNTAWTTIGQPIWDMVSFAFSSLYNLVAENMPAIQAFVSEAFAGIQDTWENHLKPAFEAIGAFLNDYVVPAFEYAWQNFILPLIENVFSLIGKLWTGTLKPIFDAICDFITGVFTGDWQKMGDSILAIVTALWNGIVAIFDTLLRYLADVWVNIESDVKTCWENVKQNITNKITEAKNNVLNIFTQIYSGIKSKIELARDTVKNAIEKIKGFFNFEWSLPDLKMPHFSISGEFSLNPPSAPSFGIDWYAKGAVLKEPTAFGMNGNKLMVGGEAGAEAIAPITTLQEYIRDAVAANDMAVVNAVNDGFAKLLAFLMQYIPELANMQVVMESGALVGQLAPGMDAALGKMAVRSGRGIE